MKTFYIFRHGETFATLKGVGYGLRIFSASMEPAGIPALEKMGEYLKKHPTDHNFSSQLKRCKQTVEIISKISGKQFIFDKRLNEYFIETETHLRKRISSLLSEIDKKGYEKIAICTHGAVIAMLIHELTKTDMAETFNIYDFPPPGILSIVQDKKIQQISFNKTA